MWPLNAMTSILIRRLCEYIDTSRKSICQSRQKLEWYSSKPRNVKNWLQSPETRKKQGNILLQKDITPWRNFQWCKDLPTPWFWTFSLQVCEIIHFFFLKAITFWRCVMAATGSEFTWQCFVVSVLHLP